MPIRFHKPLAIVPAYNEKRCVGSVVDEIRLYCPEFEVVVVDDGSTDQTANAAAEAGASVVRLPFNLGIGGAVQAGYQYAYDRGHDLAVQIDGDGQHDPAQIRTLMHHLERHPDLQMVTGSRFLDGSDVNGYKSSPIRRVGIRIFQWALSAVTRQRITDPTSGFRMTTRRGIEVFARDYPHDYPEVEAIVMLHAHRLSSAEVPCSMRPRAGGTSSINSARSGYYMIKVLLAVFVNLLRSRPSVEAGDRAPVTAEHAL